MKKYLLPALAVALVVGLGIATAAAAPGPWKDLFDGKSLDGWTQLNGTAAYIVGGGAIMGITNEGSPNSFLCSDEAFGDFELTFEVKCHDGLNSGVQIRSKLADEKNVPTRGSEPQGRVNGPQVEIEASPGQSGFLYGEATGQGWLSPEPETESHEYFKNGEWNAYRVVAEGPRIQTFVNGHLVIDLTHEEIYGTHPKGFIGLQVHGIGGGQGPYTVLWRNIKIREL